MIELYYKQREKEIAMTLITIVEKYGTHDKCIAFLESVRWAKFTFCPYCGSLKVAKKQDKGGRAEHRWNCHDCKHSFSVTVGTLFHNTKMPMYKWLMAIILEAGAKKSLSSCQLARDIEVTQKTAWRILGKIREATKTDQGAFLRGIVEMDEAYVGGKPRKTNNGGGTPNKRGRGTDKLPVVGIAERNGQIRVMPFNKKDLTAKKFAEFLQSCVDTENAVLMTDEFPAYKSMFKIMPHMTVNHSQGQYANGYVHVNTIESFWALLKRGHYGQHHHFSEKHATEYISHFAFKWGNRKEKTEHIFGKIVGGMLNEA